MSLDAVQVLAIVAGVHAGFQVTVTGVVYPALVAVPPEHWTTSHADHSRRIVLLVGPLYAALVAAGGWLVVSGPTVAGWVALLAGASTLLVTATLAAPLHGRLTDPRPEQLRRLLLVDRLRCGFAVLAFVAAVVACC